MAQSADKPIELPKDVTQENFKAKILSEATANFENQKRRHAQVDENYLLYRDRVQTNRLTQRQAVNIPIMKETIRTILPKIDERPDIAFLDKSGDLEVEIAINAKWDDDCEQGDMELVDLADKKQVLLCGRSHKKLNWVGGKNQFELKDFFDLLPDRFTNPLNINTARSITEPHIYKPLEEILSSDRYDTRNKNVLKKLIDSQGRKTKIGRSNLNQQMANAREQRMLALGGKSESQDFEAYNQLEETIQHYTHVWDKEIKQYVRYVALTTIDGTLLRAKPLKKELGVNFWPFEGWADDVEVNDYWTDATADIIRVPNQILNIWLSQFLENRTLRNFGMNYYDSSIKGFQPQTFIPRAGGWYPLPGKPGDVFSHVDIPDLSSTIDEMNFIIGIAEKASATGAIEKGVVEQAKRTLGEIEIAVGKAEERTTSLSKFYRLSWSRYAMKWYDLMDANLRDQKTTLYKRAPNGKLVGKEMGRAELISKDGVRVIATSANQQATDNVDKIQRLTAVKAEFPGNKPLEKAIQKRMLGLADLTPEEVQEIEAYEAQMDANPAMATPGQPTAPGAPAPGSPMMGHPATQGIDALMQNAGIGAKSPAPATA